MITLLTHLVVVLVEEVEAVLFICIFYQFWQDETTPEGRRETTVTKP